MNKGFLLLIFAMVGNASFSQVQSNLPLHVLDIKKAEYLYHFAYDCIDREYPNKPGEVLGDSSYLAPPRVIHPAFYGCFDWHSAVHGHWALVTILKEFPDFKYRNEIIRKISKTLTKENILIEVNYLNDKYNKDFERTYGWAWLLKLDEAILDWNTTEAKELHTNLEPLVKQISGKLEEFLDKLNYPIRVGEHSNLAFGLSFAYDYAVKLDKKLAKKIAEKAKFYFLTDCKCPATWEPGGFDFISPCLQEAALMNKIMTKQEYRKWLRKFMPGFEKNPSAFFKIAEVTDRSDGKLAHLDGLNFSRAWCLFEIGYSLGNRKMIDLGINHFDYSYKKMDTGEYAGAHWLASFALYALISSK